MDDKKFNEMLVQMSKEDLDAFLRKSGEPFDTFANDLAAGEIEELAPPFYDYVTFSGGLLDYYKAFFEKYRRYLKRINEETWTFVNTTMEVIIKHNSGIQVKFDLMNECERLMEAILQSLGAYLEGLPNIAYNNLERVFVADNMHLLNLLPQARFKGSLFRVRGKRGLNNPKELFHTPFELRNSCGSYRFSILGYPSLYLATSLETSLAECRIDDTEYSAICFRNEQLLECVDLSLLRGELCFWERYCLVLFYPLIFACGLKVKEENKPFKPEYVIPQILFQIINEHSTLMGVLYTSTRMEKPDYRNPTQKNLVLIVPKAFQTDGQSKELAKMFNCTIPVSPNEGENSCSVEKRLLKMELSELTF